MTPRQRVITALQHKEPDRVPVDLGATESSGIVGIAYNRLKKHLGIGGKTQVFDMMQMIAKVELPVVEAFGVDAVPLLIEPKQWKPWKLQDGSPAEIPALLNIRTEPDGSIVQLTDDGKVALRCPSGGYYFDTVWHPLEDTETPEGLDGHEEFFESMDLPGYCDETFDDLAVKARKLHEQTSYAVVGNLWVHLFAAGHALRGYENFMMDLLINKPLVHRFFQKQLEAYLPRIDAYLAGVGKYVDVIQVNDDLGGQSGPLVAPSVYREMIKPYHKKLWSYIKEKSGKPLLLHSCGSVYDLIPDLIEMGVDALNPIQVSAANMDSAKLKQEFGRDITFWGGGCDTQSVLCRGSVQQVREEVRRRVNDLSPGGGFVFCQVHNIQVDVPVQNICAMYEELGTLSL
ncbi:MAG: methyltransferase [Planctomycetes bacterium]|nr:methyltransferase [Planctomycetota bacterium]